MIKLVGFRRIVILLVLACMNLLVAGSYYLGLDPMLSEARTQLDAADARISELSGKIAGVKQEMAYLKDNMPRYQELTDKGLVQNQDRFRIGRLLDDLRRKAALAGFSFTIDDIQDVPHAGMAGLDYRLVNSRVNVRIVAAPLDNRVYAFLQGIGDAFSGHTHVKSFSVQRIAEVNQAILQDIADGKPVGFVNANIAFDWTTMMPKTAGPGAAPGGAGAPAPSGFRGR